MPKTLTISEQIDLIRQAVSDGAYVSHVRTGSPNCSVTLSKQTNEPEENPADAFFLGPNARRYLSGIPSYRVDTAVIDCGYDVAEAAKKMMASK